MRVVANRAKETLWFAMICQCILAQPIDETDCDFAKNEVVWGGGWVKD